ncbi:MAG: stealth family protein [Saccharospirillum sp.]
MIKPCNPPIDAVVTWVNAQDPKYRQKLNEHRVAIGEPPVAAGQGRYSESGEFAYCIASLIRYAPWLRCIYIVTDDQTPGFYNALMASPWAERIRLVSHRELFRGYEAYLPSFNIRAIKSMFWNLPELSERFVFLNDDFLIMRPVQPEDFFRGNAMVLSGSWRPNLLRLSGRKANHKRKKRPGNHAAQALAAKKAGYRWRYFRVPHMPHPMFKSLLQQYFDRHPGELEANLTYRFRSEAQFLADALVTHLALKRGRAVMARTLKTLRLKPEDYHASELSKALSLIETKDAIRFACFQSLEAASDEARETLFSWLDAWIGSPSRIFAGPEGMPGGGV